jgi:hypothetical protein
VPGQTATVRVLAGPFGDMHTNDMVVCYIHRAVGDSGALAACAIFTAQPRPMAHRSDPRGGP